MPHNRDRKKPLGPSLPHHRTNGSRIRRLGRLSQCAMHTAPALQPERHFQPRQHRLHPSHRTCAPWARRMQCRCSLASDFSSLSIPSRGTLRAFSGSCHLLGLCRTLQFVRLGSRFAQLAWVNSLAPTAQQISRGKTRYLHCIDAGFTTSGSPCGTKCTPTADGGLRVTCPLAPGASRLISGFSRRAGPRCSSPRSFGLGFLQTRLATTPLPFSLPSALRKPGHRTFTYKVTCHARHTRPG